MLNDPGKFKHVARDPARMVGRWFAIMLLAMIATSWIATAQVAARFNYQHELGSPTFGEWAAGPMGYVVDPERPGPLAHVYEPTGWVRWEAKWSWRPYWCRTLPLLHCTHLPRFSREQRRYADATFAGAHSTMFFGSISEVLAVLLFVWGRRRLLSDGEDGPTVYGSARWANRREIIATGLVVGYRSLTDKALALAGKRKRIKQVGIVLGKWTDKKTGLVHQLRTDDAQPRGALILGPPGSGKSASNFIPTLLQYNGSALVYDPSFELFFTTAGAREQVMKNDVHIFAPTMPYENDFGIVSAQCNPLDAIRWNTSHEIGGLQNFVSLMLDPADKAAEGAEAHWIVCGKALGESVFAFLRYFAPELCTFRGAYEFLSDPNIGDDVDAAFEKMMSIPLDPDGKYGFRDAAGNATPFHPHVLYSAAMTKRKPPNEKGSIVSTFLRFLEPYRDPMLHHLTSRSTLIFDDIMNGRRPQTWYFCIPEREVQRLRVWFRVMAGMTVREQMGEGALEYVDNAPVARAKHPLLLAIDEAVQLGAQQMLFMLFSAMRKYRIFPMLGFQNLSQIIEVAGQKGGAILGTMYYKCYYAASDPDTSEWVSKQLGKGTAINETRSYSGSRIGIRKNVSVSIGMHARALAEPDEFSSMAADNAVLKVTNHRAMVVERYFYKSDKELVRRARIPIPTGERSVSRDRAIAPLIPNPVSPGGAYKTTEQLVREANAAQVTSLETVTGLPQRADTSQSPHDQAAAAAAVANATAIAAAAAAAANSLSADGTVKPKRARKPRSKAAAPAPPADASSPPDPATAPEASDTAVATAANPGESKALAVERTEPAAGEVRPADAAAVSTKTLGEDDLAAFMAMGGATHAPAEAAAADDEYADDTDDF